MAAANFLLFGAAAIAPCPFCRDQKATEQLTRTLRGVMRVGLVAKGLLLKGDLDLELVLLCKDKPTSDLLEKVADNLGVQLAVSKVLVFGRVAGSRTREKSLKMDKKNTQHHACVEVPWERVLG